MNKKLEKLNQEIEKTEAGLRRAEHKEKMLEHQIKTLNRKERTHRLCTRGAMLESHLPHPESVTDGQVSAILKVLFHRGDTQRLVAQVLTGNRKEELFKKFVAGGGLRCRSGRCRANVHRTLCTLRTADDFRRFSICSNHHRGSYTSPALAPPATPFVDLPSGIILRCKLF